MNNFIFLIILEFIGLLLLIIPNILYRFNHPEMTETQLFLNFFQMYREFFRSVF